MVCAVLKTPEKDIFKQKKITKPPFCVLLCPNEAKFLVFLE